MMISSIGTVLASRNFGQATTLNINLQKNENVNFKELYNNFKISTFSEIPGKEIVECYGPVYGNPNFKVKKSIFKKIFNKNTTPSNSVELQLSHQKIAIEDMINRAKAIGANGIIGYTHCENVSVPGSVSAQRVMGIAVKTKDAT